MEGNKNAYQGSQLAKDIGAAPPEEQPPLLQRAFRSSKMFNQILETYRGDPVSKAKIEQRAKGLDVHPETPSECAQLFMDSAVTAGLGTMNGESIVLVNAASTPAPEAASAEVTEQAIEPEEAEPEAAEPELPAEPEPATPPKNGDNVAVPPRGVKADVAVNLNVDSSSDPDKLEKQLKLLRQYRLI